MRQGHLVALLLLLCAAVYGCGEGGKASSVATKAPVQTASGYLNDGDHDPSSDEDPDDLNGKKTDEDHDNEDNFPAENNSYHDGDDAPVLDFGHEGSPSDRRAIVAALKSYYAAAAAGDGSRACALMSVVFAKSVVEDYGNTSALPYLRGARTCPTLLSRLFVHVRSQVVGSFVVTGVRIKGNEAIALLGSRTAPARSIDLLQEHGAWKVSALFALPLH